VFFNGYKGNLCYELLVGHVIMAKEDYSSCPPNYENIRQANDIINEEIRNCSTIDQLISVVEDCCKILACTFEISPDLKDASIEVKKAAMDIFLWGKLTDNIAAHYEKEIFEGGMRALGLSVDENDFQLAGY
jgi:hypothetical protein